MNDTFRNPLVVKMLLGGEGGGRGRGRGRERERERERKRERERERQRQRQRVSAEAAERSSDELVLTLYKSRQPVVHATDTG